MKPPAAGRNIEVTDLSPAARTAVEKRVLDGGWDGRTFLKLLGELEGWDNLAEKKKARAKKFFIGGLIGTVAGFFIYFIAAAAGEDFVWPLPVLLIPACILIHGVRSKKAAAKIDLPNELRLCLRPVIRQLHQDLHPDEKIRVFLNLAGVDESKPSEVRDLPPGRNRALKQWKFVEDLGSVRLPLINGFVGVVRVENTYLKLERKYKSSRGKYKSKTKWKKYSTVTAMLVPPVRLQWEPARVQPHIDTRNEKVSFVEKEGILSARLDRYYKFKAMDDMPADTVPGADVVGMFVRLVAMHPQTAGGAQ